jgi:YD repeat-containing protein
VTYRGDKEPGNYTDPLMALPKSWTDEYHYDDQGRLTGWTRRRGESAEQFTPDGQLITKQDEQGRPAETVVVRYVARPRGPHEAPIIVQVSLVSDGAHPDKQRPGSPAP